MHRVAVGYLVSQLYTLCGSYIPCIAVGDVIPDRHSAESGIIHTTGTLFSDGGIERKVGGVCRSCKCYAVFRRRYRAESCVIHETGTEFTSTADRTGSGCRVSFQTEVQSGKMVSFMQPASCLLTEVCSGNWVLYVIRATVTLCF